MNDNDQQPKVDIFLGLVENGKLRSASRLLIELVHENEERVSLAWFKNIKN